MEELSKVLISNQLIFAFALVGITIWFSYWLSDTLTGGRIHGSAIAITLGLVIAWVGGVVEGGNKGIADVEVLAGIGIMGGAMFRDFAIVATAFGVDIRALKRAGIAGHTLVFQKEGTF